MQHTRAWQLKEEQLAAGKRDTCQLSQAEQACGKDQHSTSLQGQQRHTARADEAR